jgi:hypothetical protein
MEKSIEQWNEQFSQRLKTKTFEQFSLLLCDVAPAADFSVEKRKSISLKSNTNNARQKELLYNILFESIESDECNKKLSLEEKKSFDECYCKSWAEYLECTFQLHFPDRKLQLQRLVNKSLEFLNEKNLKDNKHFLEVHLFSTKLKTTDKEALRYFQHVIWKKSIGTRFSHLFLAWSEIEKRVSGPLAAIQTLQKALPLFPTSCLYLFSLPLFSTSFPYLFSLPLFPTSFL